MTDVSTHRFCRIDNTFEMEIEGHTVVVDRVSEQMITLNEVAGLIWNRLAVSSTLEEIVSDCRQQYPEVDPGTIAADAQDFLDSAAAAGLVVVDG